MKNITKIEKRSRFIGTSWHCVSFIYGENNEKITTKYVFYNIVIL